MADVAMGYAFVQQELPGPWLALILLVLASSLLYTAGMVLNDVYDIEVDRHERPFRPLPSGQIPLGWATWLGYELLVVGVALGWLAGYLYPEDIGIPWRAGAIAGVLSLCVVGYDAILKKTFLGPLAMGACRFFNVLLGMSIASETNGQALLTFDSSEIMVAGGIGVYIIGVTWFARTEAKVSNRAHLFGGTVLMVAGFLLLACFFYFGDGANRLRLAPIYWHGLLLLVGFTIVRRCMTAIFDPQAQRVQAAVKNCILSLIILDGSVCLAVQPNDPQWAIAVVALLAPTLLLGKWVYST